MMTEFVETWVGIAKAIGRSDRWCRYMADRDRDPLPVVYVGSVSRLYLAEYAAWIERQRTRRKHRRRSAFEMPAVEEHW